MPKIVYGIELSLPVRSVLVTARAVGVELQLQTLDMFEKAAHKKEPYLKLNPAHTVPTLDDDGFIIWESRSIMAYLVSKYGKDDKLYPKDVNQRATVDTILHFDNGSMFSSIEQFFMPLVFKGEAPSSEKEEVIKDRLTTLERVLSQRTYLAGDHVTIADISVVTTTSILPILGFSFDPYPKLKALIAKVKSDLPFYDEVTQKGHQDLINFAASVANKGTA